MRTIKKKSLLTLLAPAVLLLGACVQQDELAPVVQQGNETANEAVNFSVYTRNGQATRAGITGEIGLQELRAYGFGVYAAVIENANNGEGSSTSFSNFDFMNNQLVTHDDNAWVYSPLKYWPNQSGTKPDALVNSGEGKGATAGETTAVAFFAYAPYVEEASVETFSNGDNAGGYLSNEDYKDKSGILGFKKGSNTLEIVYRASMNPAEGVDLLYGVAGRDYTGTAENTSTDTWAHAKKGESPLVLTKPAVGDAVMFDFKHALTKFGITVDAKVDNGRNVAPNTRIVIESVTFGNSESSGIELYTEGTLNLSTTDGTPQWDAHGDNIFKNGIRTYFANETEKSDPKTIMSPSLRWVYSAVANQNKANGLEYFYKQPIGVTTVKRSLFTGGGTGEDGIMFIPGNNSTFNGPITVTYHVITLDPNLEHGYSDVVNTITSKNVTMNFEPGRKTILNLHIGVSSVSIDAMTTDWDYSNSDSADLPDNAVVTSISDPFSEGGIPADGDLGSTDKDVTVTYNNGESGTIKMSQLTFYICDVYGNDSLTVAPVKIDDNDDWYIPSNLTGPRYESEYSGRKVKVGFGNVTKEYTQELAQINLSGSEEDGNLKITVNGPWDLKVSEGTLLISKDNTEGSYVKADIISYDGNTFIVRKPEWLNNQTSTYVAYVYKTNRQVSTTVSLSGGSGV